MEGPAPTRNVAPPAPAWDHAPVSDARTFQVGAGDAGRRIEKLVAGRLDGASWSHVGKLIRQGRVLVDGAPAARGARVRGGEEVTVLPGDGGPAAPPQPNRKIRFEVLREEPDLALVVKPAPLAMHPGPGHGTDTFLNALVGRFPELAALGEERGWGLVHRLDRETSGVLVVARTPAGYDGLRTAFAERRVEKVYLALVQGRPPEAGEVAEPVGGKDALTRFELVDAAGPVALVRARPVTGRTHQVRLHMAGLGHPVLGDARHGHGRDELTARLYLARMALHAHRLRLPHPTGGADLEAERDLPRDLSKAWKRARRVFAAGDAP